jgi:hypothetical protein
MGLTFSSDSNERDATEAMLRRQEQKIATLEEQLRLAAEREAAERASARCPPNPPDTLFLILICT